jgi:hippurate hydrolase
MNDASPTHSLLAAAQAVLPGIVDVRRRLHRTPEIGLTLPRTQRAVVEALAELSLDARLGTGASSVVATIQGTATGAADGPTILLRADMDALPLQEDTGLDFASEIAGTMHACGHDTHVAMLLGAARLLLDRRGELHGRVLLMFQPGEEGYHGARVMLDEGLLDESSAGRVTGAFAIHIGTRYAAGTVNLRPGPQMASSDLLRIRVRGRGGHASSPHLAVDPITIAAHVVIALQTMVTRQIDVFDPAVVTIARIEAGTTNNIIPETVTLTGTIRTVSESTRAATHAAIERLAPGIAEAHGGSAQVEFEHGYPVTSNDPAFAEFVSGVAAEIVGPDAVHPMPQPIMGAEDFSYVLQRVPGVMAFLGARPASEDPATAPQNHSNRVIFDEPAMAIGAALYAAVALRHLAAP